MLRNFCKSRDFFFMYKLGVKSVEEIFRSHMLSFIFRFFEMIVLVHNETITS